MARVAAVVAMVMFTAIPGWAQEVAEAIPGHGKINWTDKTITVTGSGAPSLKAANVAVARLGAERAAKLDAFRNILEAVKGVKVSGNDTAGSLMASSPQTKSKVEGVIRNFKVLDTKYYSDGGVDLVVSVPLSGVTDALVADAGTKVQTVAAAGSTTGIIINAKGLQVTPALAPRLLTEKGGEVYSAAMVSRDAIAKHGVTGYTKSLDDARKDGRVTGSPLVVKAVKLPSKGSADLVLAEADAAKIRKMGGLLGAGKVIIVTD